MRHLYLLPELTEEEIEPMCWRCFNTLPDWVQSGEPCDICMEELARENDAV